MFERFLNGFSASPFQSGIGQTHVDESDRNSAALYPDPFHSNQNYSLRFRSSSNTEDIFSLSQQLKNSKFHFQEHSVVVGISQEDLASIGGTSVFLPRANVRSVEALSTDFVIGKKLLIDSPTGYSPVSDKLGVLNDFLHKHQAEYLHGSALSENGSSIMLDASGFHQLNTFVKDQSEALPSSNPFNSWSEIKAFSEYDEGFNHGFLEGYKFASTAQSKESEIKSGSTVERTVINITFMTNINQYGSGDNIAGDKVMGDKIDTQINNSQDLAVAARDIKNLLDQLSNDYPSDSPRILAAKALDQVDQEPAIKSRIVRGIRAGSFAALEKMIDHPVAKFFIEGAKEALKP